MFQVICKNKKVNGEFVKAGYWFVKEFYIPSVGKN